MTSLLLLGAAGLVRGRPFERLVVNRILDKADHQLGQYDIKNNITVHVKARTAMIPKMPIK
jgi:hypothetical protein